MPKPRKGDRLRYVSPYAPGVTTRYPPGIVIGFRDHGETVTVELESETADTGSPGLFADWTIEHVAPA